MSDRFKLRVFTTASVRAGIATITLTFVVMGLSFALFGPALAAWAYLPGTSGFNVAISLLLTFATTVAVPYRIILNPLYKESRPDSRYARRWIEAATIQSLQIIFALVVAGPLQILFLGRDDDPFGITSWLRNKSRALDSHNLKVRPPIYTVDGKGREITIPLRDGVETAATLYSPNQTSDDDRKNKADDSPRPVVLIRTPYNRASLARYGFRFAERGYHLVTQDTRGRFGSTGEFFPMLNEARDGAATIEWIEKQPWCNGSVGMMGPSYLGLCALAAMREEVPALKAVAPIMAATDLYAVMFGREAGAAHVELIFRWSHLVMHLMSKPFGMLEAMFTFFHGTGTALRKAYRHSPLNEADTLYLVPNSEPLEWFRDGFAHPLGTEPFWDDKRHFVQFENMTSIPPVLLFCGWYDFFSAESCMYDWKAMRKLNEDCRMVIGPYTHWHVQAMQPKLWRTLLDFFDRHLLGDAAARELPSVDAFAMGHDMGWMQMADWPPPYTKEQKFGMIRGKDGDPNKLIDHNNSAIETFVESEISYVYDPSDPTPQVGGATFNPSCCGRLSQNAIESRNDVLVFSSEPLESPMLIAGEIKVHLEVVSNVEGTDYVARACQVTSDGESVNLADGIIRRFNLRPGRRTMVDITLSPVLNRLGVGDHLRLQICSSAYPKYGRHLNTRGSFHLEIEANAVVSEQILIVGGDSGCCITVPVLPA
mmetsp:Transcript_33586/g.61833  ORF Transcript_33586/g.61833 Transcript_33586/m.61833 type:complete len:709 (-) Transcript_33586:83-2209(-)